MAYTPTVWEDNVTPVTAVNLNKMESGIAAAETPEGAQAKASEAQAAAATYTNTKATDHLAALDPHTQYALDTDLSSLAGAGRTTETVKGLADAAAIHQADLVYQVAGGTATVLTVTMGTLVDGYAKTFIASANNSGAATTINTKPLYKPNTTTAPTLIAGKAYTVWYKSSSNCFFIKASAEGIAVVANVLAGQTFSNDSDTGLIGAMPNKVGSNEIYTVSTVDQPITQGYRGGVVADGKVKGEANLVTGNIRAGITIAGIAGKASVVDTSDANVIAGQILAGLYAYVNGVKLTGTMPNNGTPTATITTQGGVATIPAGYNPGGTITANMTNLVASVITSGNVVGGITGTASNIKSIQRGQAVFTSQTTINVTISLVDLTKSIVIVELQNGNETDPTAVFVQGKLNSSTQLNLSRQGVGNSNALSIRWTVIEFNNVKSLQTGTSGISTGTVTISTVDPAKSLVFFSISCYVYPVVGTNAGDVRHSAWFNSSTQIELTFSGNVSTIYWYVVEFN